MPKKLTKRMVQDTISQKDQRIHSLTSQIRALASHQTIDLDSLTTMVREVIDFLS